MKISEVLIHCILLYVIIGNITFKARNVVWVAKNIKKKEKTNLVWSLQ